MSQLGGDGNRRDQIGKIEGEKYWERSLELGEGHFEGEVET